MFSWNNGKSSKLLSESLGIKRIKKNNSRYRPKAGDIILNWGATNIPSVLGYGALQWINHYTKIRGVTNKLNFFQKVYNYKKDIGPLPFNTPDAFFSHREAQQWLHEGEGTRTLVARTLVASHEGQGIVLCENPLDVIQAPLYTAYVKKKWEFRCHIFKDTCIGLVKKVKKRGYEGDRNTRIRNTANGYVFAAHFDDVPQKVRNEVVDQSVAAIKFFGLDFGAVDVIYNEYQDKVYILEINTAPGIEGRTIQTYTDAIKKEYNL